MNDGKKGIILFILFTFSVQVLVASSGGNKELNIGLDHQIIYDSTFTYEQYNYSGPAPLFLTIWFPVKGKLKGDFISMQKLLHPVVPPQLEQVYSALLNKQLEIVVRDALNTNVSTEEEINYPDSVNGKLLHYFSSLTTASKAGKFKKSSFPVIVYHHGSQGFAAENWELCEYFAKRGFIVVSSNFHWSFKDVIFGLFPYHFKRSENYSEVHRMIRWAKENGNGEVIFIGHSWGAQQGWCTLHNPGPVKAFVSLETTVEMRSDTSVIQEFWPLVYESLKTNSNKLPIPVLQFSNTEKDEPFAFFEKSCTSTFVQAGYKTYFPHNAYTSVFFSRMWMNEQLNNPDQNALLLYHQVYVKHLEMIYQFLLHYKTTKLDYFGPYSTDFYLHYPNQ